MKIFGRTGGYYLFWCSFVYLAIGLTFAVYFKEVPAALFQIVWLSALALPFTYPPLGRWLNMSIEWDKNMFNWLKGRSAKEYLDNTSNVVKFPKPEAVPYVEPPKAPEKPAVTYYTLGMTSENRLELKIGHSAITMNHGGLRNFMDQLEVFSKQLAEYEDTENTETKI